MTDAPQRDRAETATQEPSSFLGRGVLYPTQYIGFIVLASLDITLTWMILFVHGGREVNKIAEIIFFRWGLDGMILFRFLMLVIVVSICEVIGRKSDPTGRRLAWFAVAVNFLPLLTVLAQLLYLRLTA